MDDTARGFHAEIVKDLNEVLNGVTQDKPELALRAVMSVLATVITDVNRIARAGERIADAQEQLAHSMKAIARVNGSFT